jgi:hypothetical protein
MVHKKFRVAAGADAGACAAAVIVNAVVTMQETADIARRPLRDRRQPMTEAYTTKIDR